MHRFGVSPQGSEDEVKETIRKACMVLSVFDRFCGDIFAQKQAETQKCGTLGKGSWSAQELLCAHAWALACLWARDLLHSKSAWGDKGLMEALCYYSNDQDRCLRMTCAPYLA